MPTSSGNTIIIDVDAFRNEVDLTIPDEPIDLTGPPPIIDLPKIEEDRKFRKQRARLRAKSRNKSSGGSLTPQSRTPPLAQPSSSAKIFIVESSPPPVDVAMELSPPPVEAAVVGPPPSPHRSPEYELMELILSDEERGSERMQISDEDDSTSDEEYPWMWTPIKQNANKMESSSNDNTTAEQPHMMPSTFSRYQRPPDISDQFCRGPKGNLRFIWDLPEPNRSIRSINPPGKWDIPRKSVPRHQSSSPRSRVISSFKRAPGSINRIIQDRGLTVICSAAIGGQTDQPGETPNPHNHDGSLLLCHEERTQVLDGHSRPRGNLTKYYGVSDVKFSPDPNVFVSAGNDGSVQAWSYDHDSSDWTPEQLGSFTPHSPHSIAFKPGSSSMAIAAGNIHIIDGVSTDASISIFPIAPRKARQVAGAMVWGVAPTSNMLFTSSEPTNETYRGYHTAFDTATMKIALKFDLDEAGDAVCINAHGDTLAITSRREDGNTLRLFDVRRNAAKPHQMISLDSFPQNMEGEVNAAVFSPDGVYLALARNDNRTNIYDSRMIDRRVLYNYEHMGPSRVSPGLEAYGVVHVEWVETASRRLGIVTGGADGCVRFWDPLVSSSNPVNGVAIAESYADIGHFSLGDHSKGECELIIGDCSGEVYFIGGKDGFPLIPSR